MSMCLGQDLKLSWNFRNVEYGISWLIKFSFDLEV